jgi:predicted AAA+ superfamily ATPase
MSTTNYYPREIASRITRALKVFPVVVLCGPRQCGKSTLLQRDPAPTGRAYLTLDDLDTSAALRDEPEGVLSSEPVITLDEAQRAPELFLAIKRLVDKHGVPGRFLLSGSADFLLLAKLGDSLAGRACYLNLAPFSAREFRRKTGAAPFLVEVLRGKSPVDSARDRNVRFEKEDVLRGGFPPARLFKGDEYAEWFRGYEQTYLERDVRQVSQVADLTAFRTLLRLAALRTSQVLNQSELGRDAKLNAVTTGRYLSLQETSCLLHRFPPYHGSKTARLVKSPKLYLADSGLAAFL